MNESGKALRIEVQDIDHLGIVAGIVDAAGLVEEIDRRLGAHPQEHLSCGQAVKAMILNGLGFLSAPLYLFEEFFSGKATEHLIGPGVRAEHLNDDRSEGSWISSSKPASPSCSWASRARPQSV